MTTSTPPQHCRNCGAPLAGEYCSRCGQREGRADRGFRDLLAEAVEELFSWDSRFWRTMLPLLFRPGFLTAQYIAGRRARYVPPLRLYLIISFVMFLVLSLTTDGLVRVVNFDSEGPGATAVRSGMPPDGPDHATAQPADPALPDVDSGIGLADEDSPRWLRELDARVEANAVRAGRDPAAFTEMLLGYLPQMMFFMLPVFALLLRGCYLLSPFHYLQHVVFTLHFYSFAYLLYLLGAALNSWFAGAGRGDVLLALLALYLALGLRRTYGSGWPGAIGKALTLLLVNAVVLLLVFSAVVLVVLAVA